MDVVWTDYLRYRAALRGFDLETIGEIVRHSKDRYRDTVTGRYVAVGHCGDALVLVPYETDAGQMTPVTIHATTRRQIAFRLRTGRFVHG